MPIYSDLTLHDERFVELRRFSYNFLTNDFILTNSYKEIDEDLKEFFNPHFLSNSSLRTNLEKNVLLLMDKKGSFEYDDSYYSPLNGLRYFKITGNNENDINVVSGIIFDITNERNLLEKIDHAERLRTIGELSSGIAHDFNNNLMVITGASELLLLGDLNEKQKSFIEKIMNAAKRSANLTKKLLVLSKNNESDEIFDLVEVLLDAIDIIVYTSKGVVDIRFEPNITNAFIFGNKSLIANAIINILKNAIEASKNEIIIDVSITLEFIDIIIEDSIFTDIPNDFFYKITVKDYGVGIKEEDKKKIFNPFYSTKESLGTGLGLSTVLSTIISSGGMINLKSEYGLGTTFNLFFKKF